MLDDGAIVTHLSPVNVGGQQPHSNNQNPVKGKHLVNLGRKLPLNLPKDSLESKTVLNWVPILKKLLTEKNK